MSRWNRKIHLAQFLVHGPTFHSIAMWRHPRTAEAGFDWTRPDVWQHVAKTCERGLFDMAFFADLNFIADTYKGTLEPALRYATQAPEHDPVPLLSYMAAVTSRIGLAATFSTSQHHPFYAARLWATLDHLTGGRAGWNVVTSVNRNQDANFGVERPPADERYDRAHEFMEVCRKLWASWDEGALVMDRKDARFADHTRVHRIDHQGRFFKSRGPLNVVRSPRGAPAIMQAGVSPKGQDFAAKHADAIFAIQPNADHAKAYYESVKSHMEGIGRDPRACKMLFGMQPIIGASEGEARDRQAEHNALVPLEGGMTILSNHLDLDLSSFPTGTVLADRNEPELQRLKGRFYSPDGRALTMEEVAQRHGQSVGLPQFVGTPSSIADQMEAFMAHVGGDGFMISPICFPGAIEDFVDLVVPELQRRGLARTAYAGSTLKDHLSQHDRVR
ncbi:MAG: NtaA/DmoA family FMN-dependent monooxygenase [Hyphomicrobiaceae bacterium]|nr:NtaA/DmoA family FMN-dependent monooxygenase [Hyphomicrobiaceae bacterium]